MAETTYERKTFATGYVFGAPIKELGWLAMLVMGVASGVIAFFFATFCGIVFVLFYNAAGHHADFTVSYRLMGMPAGIVVATLTLAYLGTFWMKRIFRRA